jgi:predicted transcriptional regulator
MGKQLLDVSRRERQILDVVYRAGSATAAEVLAALPDPPSYSAVRASLTVLERKGHLRHAQDGPRYVYLPTLSRERASRSVLRNLVQTFFEGSTEKTVAALLELSRTQLTDEDFDRLTRLIDRAREEGR